MQHTERKSNSWIEWKTNGNITRNFFPEDNHLFHQVIQSPISKDQLSNMLPSGKLT